MDERVKGEWNEEILVFRYARLPVDLSMIITADPRILVEVWYYYYWPVEE